MSSPTSGTVPPMYNQNAMKLGVFSQNLKGGAVMTTARGTLEGTWDEQPPIAQAADDAGFEFLLPVGRWRSLGGPSQPAGKTLEVFTWAAAVAAITRQITVLATAHVPIFHPLLAAKQGATVDQIANGRFGINVVVGWNADEFDMFDIAQFPHDERYAVGSEWITIVKRLWSEESVDFAGKYYTVRDGQLSPKPTADPRPVLVNAGQSPAGFRYAAEHMDYTFQAHPDMKVLAETAGAARRLAREDYDRDLGILTMGYVVCADTEREAQAYVDYYVDEKGDTVAAQTMIDQMLAGDSRSMPADFVRQMQRSLIAGWGGIPLVGTAEQIVDRFLELQAIGISGVAMSWVNYREGIERFTAEVLPLMVEAGLRQP